MQRLVLRIDAASRRCRSRSGTSVRWSMTESARASWSRRGGGWAHADLRLVNLFGRCGIDAPVEAEHVACAVGLQALGLRRRGQHHGSPQLLEKKTSSETVPFDGTKDGPVGGAVALEAGVDDVFRLVGLVGLRNQAAAVGERDPGRQAGSWGNALTGR